MAASATRDRVTGSRASIRAASSVCRESGTASVADVADQCVDAFARYDDVLVDQRPHRLDREERDALGLGRDRHRPPRPAAAAHQAVEQATHRRRRSGVEGDQGAVPADAEAGSAATRSRAGRRARIISGMSRLQSTRCSRKSRRPWSAYCSVLDEQQHRAAAGRAARRSAAIRRRAPRGSARPRSAEWQARAGGRCAVGRSARSVSSANRSASCVVELGARSLSRRVLVGHAEPDADDLGERPEGDVLAERQASAAVPVHRARQGRRRTSRTPSRAGTCRHPAGPVTTTSARLPVLRDVACSRSLTSRNSTLAPDERAPPARRRAATPPTPDDDLAGAPQRLGLGLALELERRRQRRSRWPGEASRLVVLSTSTRARRRDALDPSGGVDRVAGHHALARGRQGDRDLAGDDAGARGQPAAPIWAPRSATAATMSRRGPDRSLGVALEGHAECPTPPSPRRR